MSARRFLRLTHGWMGAVLALFILLVAGSGASLAFMSEMFIAQYGEVLEAEAPSPRSDQVGIGEMFASAQRSQGEGFLPGGVLMPHSRVPGVSTAMVYGIEQGADPSDITMVSVDPWTGVTKGSFALADAFGHDMIDFHFELVMGDWGATFVSVLGLLLVAFVLTGLWLWWPRQGSALKKARNPALHGRLRDKLYQLHGWLGIWTAILVIFFALSGTAATRPQWFGPLLSNPLAHAPSEGQWAVQCEGHTSFGEAADLALESFPGTEITTLTGFPGQPITIFLRGEGDFNRLQGDAIAWVHPTCDGVIETRANFSQSFSEKIGGSMLSLHGGYTFGPILGPILVVITGLSLVFFCLSGIYVFFTRTLRGVVSLTSAGRTDARA